MGWGKYVGLDGAVHGIERFGASAKYADLQKAFGFLPEDVVREAEAVLGEDLQRRRYYQIRGIREVILAEVAPEA